MSTINERIAQVVAHSGLTKTAFGEKLNISQPHVSRLCTTAVPSDRTINDICREFSVDPLWLRTGDGEMIRPMSRETQIHAYLSELMGGQRSPVEEALVSALSRIPSEHWHIIESIIDTFYQEYQKTKKDTE